MIHGQQNIKSWNSLFSSTTTDSLNIVDITKSLTSNNWTHFMAIYKNVPYTAPGTFSEVSSILGPMWKYPTGQPRDAQTDGNPGSQSVTTYHITPRVHTVPSFHLSGPHHKHLAGNQFVTNASAKQDVLLGQKQLTLISMPEHKPWCHSDIMYHLQSMCCVHIKVRIQFSPSKGLVCSFLSPIWIKQGCVSSAYYTCLLAQNWLRSSHNYVSVHTILMSHTSMQHVDFLY
jgi:hypothetical protein